MDSSDSTGFLSEANEWTLSSSVCSTCDATFTIPSNDCDISQETILGGPNILGPDSTSTYGQYFERYYPDLDSETTGVAAVEFDLWVFYDEVPSDSSDTNFYGITIDSGYSSVIRTLTMLEDSCTLDYADSSSGVTIKAFYKFHVQMFLSHYYTSHIDMRFISLFTVDSTVSSFGFRNFQYYWNSNVMSSYSIDSGYFPCYTGYSWSDSSCIECHSFCETCTGTTYNDCSSCKDGYYDYGNGTCLATCSLPFVATTTSGYPYLCDKPCSDNEDYFYWFSNQSCTETCEYPLYSSVDSNNINICSNPCYYNDETLLYVGTYLYPDRICGISCEPPLIVYTPRICQNRCDNTDDFTFENGSCTDECSSPLVSSNASGIFYCNSPCSGEYIYPDGDCSAECEAPMIKKDESSDIKFCGYPCEDTEDYYYYGIGGTCKSYCPYPYVETDSPLPKLCESSLSEEEISQVNKLAKVVDIVNLVLNNGILVGSVLSSSDSTSIFMGIFGKMLSYVKYMDVGYPEKVMRMFEKESENARGFADKILAGVIDEFPEEDLPEKFMEYGALSSFFVNFWPALLNLLVIVFVLGVGILMKLWKGKCQCLKAVGAQIEKVMKWNALLINFCGDIGDIVLFTALELQTTDFGSAGSGISFGFCLFMNLMGIFVAVKILTVNSAIWKLRKNFHKEEEQIEQNWRSFKALFASYKGQFYFQQIFLFIFLTRTAILTGIIGCLYKYPLFQAIIINIIHISILLYLIFMKPFEQRASLFQQIILEGVLLPFNLCVLLLAILDARGIEARDKRKKIGNIMISINVIIPVLSVAFLATKFAILGFNACCKRKKPEKRKNSRPQRLNIERRKAASPKRIRGNQRPKAIFKASTFDERANNPMQALEITQSPGDLSTSPETLSGLVFNQSKINDGSVRLENSIMSEENSLVHEQTTAEFKSREDIIEVIDEEIEWSDQSSPGQSKEGILSLLMIYLGRIAQRKSKTMQRNLPNLITRRLEK